MPLVENENGYRTGTINVNGEIHEIKPDANLEGTDLHGANLHDADLSGAYLFVSDLRRANLSDSNLTAANLSYADLRDADLRRADLEGADLSGADLSFADLSGADLSGADLYDADLHGADLTNVQMTHQDWQDIRDIRDGSRNVDQAIGIPDSRRPVQVQSRPVPKGIQKLYEDSDDDGSVYNPSYDFLPALKHGVSIFKGFSSSLDSNKLKFIKI
jgi:hypothetical protein